MSKRKLSSNIIRGAPADILRILASGLSLAWQGLFSEVNRRFKTGLPIAHVCDAGFWAVDDAAVEWRVSDWPGRGVEGGIARRCLAGLTLGPRLYFLARRDLVKHW
jgi:hypothetical protein